MATKITLFDLPLDIVRELEEHELFVFRLVSQACRRLSEPILFRTVTLHDHLRTAKESPMGYVPLSVRNSVNTHFCDRLRNPDDELRKHVRRFNVGPYKFSRLCPEAQVLADVLRNIESLTDFSWNVAVPMPDEVLAILSAKWPDVKLHVTNGYRGRCSPSTDSVLMPLNTRLLSSPQLFALDCTVYGHWTDPNQKEGHLSELPSLKTCLLQATSLKRLRLAVKLATSPQDTWASGPGPNFDFQAGEVFPALEYLSLVPNGYDLSEGHCQQWLAAMDWSKLRRLDLGDGSPAHLFSALTGKVPQLKALHFGFWPDSSEGAGGPGRQWSDFSAVERFLGAIDGLEEVVLNKYWHDFSRFHDSLLMKHGRTMRKLHILAWNKPTRINDERGWNRDDTRVLVERCPSLQDLAISVAMERHGNGSEYIWLEPAMHEIVKLPCLRNLEVDLDLHDNCYEFFKAFSAAVIRFLDKPAQDTVLALFKYMRTRPQSPIESVKVKFNLRKRHACWDYTVKRRYGTDLGFVVEKASFGTGPSGLEPLDRQFDAFG